MTTFISSTVFDLEPYREAASVALDRLGQHPIRLEMGGARPQEPRAACLAEIESSHLFVGLYGHRYGFMPPGLEQSITEIEYDHARALRKPMFCFMISHEVPCPNHLLETSELADRLRRFKSKVQNQLVVDVFKTPDDLGYRIATSVGRYLASPGYSIESWLRDGRPDPGLPPTLIISSITGFQDGEENCTVDLRVFNNLSHEVSINAVRFHVDDVVVIPTLGFMDFSHVYDLDISNLQETGASVSCPVSQKLRPGEVDRFGIRLAARTMGTGIFRGWRFGVALDTSAGRIEAGSVEVWLPHRLWNLDVASAKSQMEQQERELGQLRAKWQEKKGRGDG